MFVDFQNDVTAKDIKLALKEGLIVLPAGIHGEVVELAPPATITQEQMDFAVKCLSKILLESQL